MSEDKATTLTGADYTADDYDGDAHVPAEEALRRLVEGNRIYVEALDHERDLSQERIADLFENGQRPFACVITCADSRVVPEHVFMTGLGELFVIRVAGNVVGPIELASAVYACEHLHTRLLLVLGHTHCGAIKAALDWGRGAGGRHHRAHRSRPSATCATPTRPAWRMPAPPRPSWRRLAGAGAPRRRARPGHPRRHLPHPLRRRRFFVIEPEPKSLRKVLRLGSTTLHGNA